MTDFSAPVLVTGATGKQGGAAARALLSAGIPVRALVRDPTTAPAGSVAALGAELVTGDLRDRDSLLRAAEGASAVFSVQMPAWTGEGIDFAGELVQGTNLIEAAKDAGVRQFVQSSVSGAGRHRDAPGWAEGRWESMAPALETKTTLQNRLRAAAFERWTLLKPCFFMENFLPSAAFMFPRGIESGLVTALKPGTRLSLIAVDDIGRAAAAAVADPERFDRVELELASDYLSMAEIAETLSVVLGRDLPAPDLTEEQALALGMPPVGSPHDWLNVVGQPARPQYLRDLGVEPTSFADWARRNMLN